MPIKPLKKCLDCSTNISDRRTRCGECAIKQTEGLQKAFRKKRYEKSKLRTTVL